MLSNVVVWPRWGKCWRVPEPASRARLPQIFVTGSAGHQHRGGGAEQKWVNGETLTNALPPFRIGSASRVDGPWEWAPLQLTF